MLSLGRLPKSWPEDKAGLEDPDVHGGVVLGHALVHEGGTQGNQGGGADAVKDLGEDEKVLEVGEILVRGATRGRRRRREGPATDRRKRRTVVVAEPTAI